MQRNGTNHTSNPTNQRSDPGVQYSDLDAKPLAELRERARELGISGYSVLKKHELVNRILQAQSEEQGNLYRTGLLETIDDGYGFLRLHRYWNTGWAEDVYVAPTQIRRLSLRTGDMIAGQVRPPKEGEKYYGLLRVETVNNLDPEEAKRRPHFENLTAIFPDEHLNLETASPSITGRLINLVSPIGRGQRGLVVAPPKTGKTMLLQSIANAVMANYPDVHVMVVLIGERPEEVTDWERSVGAEVVASTFDEIPENQTRIAELALERAKRMVEGGQDVMLLLDSITRLTRAYNQAIPPSGRTLSGGIDPAAIYPPKRFYGAARNVENGSSLTMIANCLVETESRMDDVIYEEFKGTGNMELRLDRKFAERRIYPAIDVARSGTRREELLFESETLQKVITLRRMLSAFGNTEGYEAMLKRLERTKSNADFLARLSKDAV
jgi:transcription termination factor Rho